jgi:hypothetical protein
MKGGSLSQTDIKNFINKSYEKHLSNYKDFLVDRDLSTQTGQVYHNPKTNQAVVVHRGTASISDVGTDIAYGLTGYKSKRFKAGEGLQQKAEKKYGAENVTTLGHSLGSLIGQTAGKNSKEIINYNKPVTPLDLFTKKVPENQYDIRSKGDVLSILRPLQRGKKEITLDSSKDPLAAHSTSSLPDSDVLIGKGLKKIQHTVAKHYFNIPPEVIHQYESMVHKHLGKDALEQFRRKVLT